MAVRDADLGYDRSSLSWTYRTPIHEIRTSDFHDKYELIGERALEILNAAKRLKAHGRPNTIVHAVEAVRTCSDAIAAHAPKATTVSEWAEAMRKEIDAYPRAEVSKWHLCNVARAILAEVSRVRDEPFNFKNPYNRKRTEAVAIFTEDEQARIIKQARSDAYAYYRDFKSPPKEFASFVEQARAYASTNGGLLPRSSRKGPSGPFNAFVQRCYKVGLTVTAMERMLYATPDSLIPFMILITSHLAANVDSVGNTQTECMVQFVNPLLGPRYKVSLDKPRAGSIEPYSVADSGALGVPWLVRAVTEMTEPLRCMARNDHADFLFLVATTQKVVRPLYSGLRWSACRRYLKERCGLAGGQRLNMLRPTRAVHDYAKFRDPLRSKRLLRHAHLSTTIPYLDNALAQRADEELIADVQGTLLEARLTRSSSSADGAVSVKANLSSHSCSDPLSADHGHDENGLCVNFLWPLNDRHFVMSLEPRPVAFLLRDYEALCEAELRLSTERFAKIWLPKKRYIEDQYLPLIDEELKQRALQILPSLGPTPRID